MVLLQSRVNAGFITGTLIGMLGGLIGLGGAEFLRYLFWLNSSLSQHCRPLFSTKQ